MVIRKRTLERYFKYSYSVKKVDDYKKISAQNEWWDEKIEEEQEPISKKISKWLDLVARVKKGFRRQAGLPGIISMFSRIRMKFRPSPSRSRFSFISIPELRPESRQFKTVQEKLSLPLINMHRKRRQTRKRDSAPLSKTEEVIREFKQIRAKIELISLTVEQLQRKITGLEVKLKAKESRSGSNNPEDFEKERSNAGPQKEQNNNLHVQLRRLLIEANSSMSKNEILQRLNEIVYPERESIEDVFADSYQTSENSSRAILPEMDPQSLNPIVGSTGLKKHRSLKNFASNTSLNWNLDEITSVVHEDPSVRTGQFVGSQIHHEQFIGAAKAAGQDIPDESYRGDSRVLPQFYTTILGTNPNLTKPQPQPGPSLFNVAKKIRLRMSKALTVFFKKRVEEDADNKQSSVAEKEPAQALAEPQVVAKLTGPTKTLRTTNSIIKIARRLKVRVGTPISPETQP